MKLSKNITNLEEIAILQFVTGRNPKKIIFFSTTKQNLFLKVKKLENRDDYYIKMLSPYLDMINNKYLNV